MEEVNSLFSFVNFRLQNERSSECSSTTSTTSSRESPKPAAIRPPNEPPPAYSRFATTRVWNRTVPISVAAAGFSALLVCLLVGALIARILVLNALLAENERLLELWKKGGEAGPKSTRECWSRVANLTKELADQERESRAAVARLEAEAAGLREELAASTRAAGECRREAEAGRKPSNERERKPGERPQEPPFIPPARAEDGDRRRPEHNEREAADDPRSSKSSPYVAIAYFPLIATLLIVVHVFGRLAKARQFRDESPQKFRRKVSVSIGVFVLLAVGWIVGAIGLRLVSTAHV
ncbi:hypothetical protein M3Y99_01187600 [Aphelenchoides fujianensis]|nr:hypothetical protein M3Y99_01187600 [Aphelenchoides fujianensis]